MCLVATDPEGLDVPHPAAKLIPARLSPPPQLGRADKQDFLRREPQAKPYFHRWFGSREFPQGVERWVLWLGEVPPATLQSMPESLKRVRAVRDGRSESKSAPTRKLAATPTRFHVENMPAGDSILIPKVSSERRRYIPLGMMEPGSLCSDLVFLMPNATPYHFGVLHSRVHNAWMGAVCGRLEGRFRYSGGVVYNNFVWPQPSDEQQRAITAAAERVLQARGLYSDSTISQMYDPDSEFLYPVLMQAHAQLDRLVEEAYGLQPGMEDTDVVAHLFDLYAEKVNG